MRYGFTTGSCAAAAAKAAAYMLLSGMEKNEIRIDTPKGIPYATKIQKIIREKDRVSCAVEKDSGDDPDVTKGTLIYSRVSYAEGSPGQVIIDGGKGVGRVTGPGLDQPVGNAAINHVPREMITREVKEVCSLFDYKGALLVIVSVPEGEELALKTFNPRLGIEGGISILGTSGIVEPMSEQALIDTIKVELSVKKAMGLSCIAISPGNYGLDFMKASYGFDLDKAVKCSNFIGESLDAAGATGFQKVLLTGHIGKLVKVSLGIMNTHSKYGDHRMEALLMCMELLESRDKKIHFTVEVKEKIASAVTTEEAIGILKETPHCGKVLSVCMDKILEHLRQRAKGAFEIECIMYSNQYGLLAKSPGADALLKEIKG